MGHHLDAYLARPEVLLGLEKLLPGARMLPLAQGLWFAPVPDVLRDLAMTTADNDNGGPFLRLVEVLDLIGLELSKRGEVGWIETDFFGGMGESRARLWRHGAVVIDDDSVNAVLKAMGVQRMFERHEVVESSWLLRTLRKFNSEPIKQTLLDEWDSVGLALHRNTESCYQRAKPVEHCGFTDSST